MGVEILVLAGISGSRLDQPIEFIESRNEVDAMLFGSLYCVLLTVAATFYWTRYAPSWLLDRTLSN